MGSIVGMRVLLWYSEKTTARSDEKPICTNRAFPSESHGVSLVYGLISRDGGWLKHDKKRMHFG